MNWEALTDIAILGRLGVGIKQMRLNANRTQQQIATIAGVDRMTLSRLENGRSADFLTIIQVLRALRQLDLFNAWEQRATISPLVIARLEKKRRRRASAAGPPPPKPPESEW